VALLAMPQRLLQTPGEITFSEQHAARRRAQNERQIFGGFPAGLLPRFQRSQHEHHAGAVKPGN